MLKVNYNNKEYKFPQMNPMQWNSYVYGTINLDNNWRELDYKNGGHTLNIGAISYFEVPKQLFNELYKSEFFFSEQIINEIEDGESFEKLPIIYFNLDINFTKIFDFNTYESVLIGNIKSKFPTFKELENLVLDKEIIEDSLLRLSDSFNYEPTLTAIRFGKIKNNSINLICIAEFETRNKTKGVIEINVWLPINFYFEAGVYSNSFPNLSIKERLIEVRDCFATVYNISEYDLTEKIVDQKNKRVKIQFQNKKWN
ncbi:hypothetical protein [uncultured Polaribacter sp.]|uniref:hypothetical protein n=1 Tax=uncultured Polaribacter sp. TaxID=174711 RepID=UPI002621FDD8|nr:hypothetical protein [uncultured Polaribacter sp.]